MSDAEVIAASLPRVGLIADLLEERWPSMDMMAAVMTENISKTGAVNLSLLRPPMRRRFSAADTAAGRGYTADRVLNRFWDYPRWIRPYRNEFDLFHLVDHSYAQLLHELPAGRTVVTCHDLDTFRSVLEPARERRGPVFRAMVRRTLSGFRKAAAVICISEATREELLAHQLLPPERVVAINNGLHPACSPAPNAEADARAAAMLGVDPSVPLLVHVSSTIPRKRIDVLLRVFAEVRKQWPTAWLARVGTELTPEQQTLANELGIADVMVRLPFVPHDVLAAVYRRASVVLMPSETEGFGMPVLEGSACGAPVVASDIPALREIGGDGATYCAVGDVAGWAATVSDILYERDDAPERWQARRARALANASRFSWAANARRTIDVYQMVLAG